MKPGWQSSILQDRGGLRLHEPLQSQLLDLSQGPPVPSLLQCLAQILWVALHPGEHRWDVSPDDGSPLYLRVMQLICLCPHPLQCPQHTGVLLPLGW